MEMTDDIYLSLMIRHAMAWSSLNEEERNALRQHEARIAEAQEVCKCG